MTSVGLGGYFDSRRPISLARELLRQQAPVDEIISITGSLEVDIAVHLESVTRATIGAATLGVFGLLPMLRESVRSGRVELVSPGATSLIRGLQAGARSDEFAISRSRPPLEYVGSVKEQQGVVTSIRPDEVLLHVPYADPHSGTAWAYGIGTDLLLAAASESVTISYDIAVVEPPRFPNLTVIPPHLVRQLHHVPFGAFPSICWPLYGPCPPAMRRYAESKGGLLDSDFDRALRTDTHEDFLASMLSPDDLDIVLGFGASRKGAVGAHLELLARWRGDK